MTTTFQERINGREEIDNANQGKNNDCCEVGSQDESVANMSKSAFSRRQVFGRSYRWTKDNFSPNNTAAATKTFIERMDDVRQSGGNQMYIVKDAVFDSARGQ